MRNLLLFILLVAGIILAARGQLVVGIAVIIVALLFGAMRLLA